MRRRRRRERMLAIMKNRIAVIPKDDTEDIGADNKHDGGNKDSKSIGMYYGLRSNADSFWKESIGSFSLSR
jgi:hypothetical protein